MHFFLWSATCISRAFDTKTYWHHYKTLKTKWNWLNKLMFWPGHHFGLVFLKSADRFFIVFWVARKTGISANSTVKNIFFRQLQIQAFSIQLYLWTKEKSNHFCMWQFILKTFSTCCQYYSLLYIFICSNLCLYKWSQH